MCVGGYEGPKLANAASRIWFTDSAEDLRKVSAVLDLEWPRTDGECLGFGFEVKGGRVVFLVCKSTRDFETWQAAMSEFVPESATHVRAHKRMMNCAAHLANENTDYKCVVSAPLCATAVKGLTVPRSLLVQHGRRKHQKSGR